uniref:Uncharacterized protein n=1 Tax=Monopterus albus TaxID=43700 RepID=A0A3Q3QDC6_MONAL
MSAAKRRRSEDQFLCSICLDVFTDPVSTSCGHNYCKTCITHHWDVNVPYMCPMCKKVFKKRPKLNINTFISEMVADFRREAQQKASSSSSEQQAAKPGEVPCDVCTGTKVKALKSCLVCLTSYCETHLEPHLTAPRLKKHQLFKPVENLEGRMCRQHDKPLELFCKTDQMYICVHCPVLEHRTHEFVPLKEEYERKKAELGKTEAEIQQMIQKRREKIEELKQSVRISKEGADREIAAGVQVFTALKESVGRGLIQLIKEIDEQQETTEQQAEGFITEREKIEELKQSVRISKEGAAREKAAGVQVFTALKESVERGLIQLIKEIDEQQETTEQQAEGFITELEQEISELRKRSTEVEQLSHSEDHLHLLQSFSSLKTAAPTKDWTEVRVRPPSYEGTVVRAVAQVEETLRKQMKKLFEPELKRVQQFAVDVTLDPDTAQPNLILSDDGKQVNHGDVKKNLPDKPERFSLCLCVLGKQSFSSGRFYFEVQVKGKTGWALGVARESVDRKRLIVMSPQDGYWTVWLINGNGYRAHTVRLSLKSGPEKVGVFVDYEEGLVSFYDVDAAALIYSFTGCCFTEKLYPFFSPCNNDGGRNSAPLIICPVNQTEL